jgi:hypothetical protein
MLKDSYFQLSVEGIKSPAIVAGGVTVAYLYIVDIKLFTFRQREALVSAVVLLNGKPYTIFTLTAFLNHTGTKFTVVIERTTQPVCELFQAYRLCLSCHNSESSKKCSSVSPVTYKYNLYIDPCNPNMK